MNWKIIFPVLLLSFSMPSLAAEIPQEAVEKLSKAVHEGMADAKLPDGTLIGKEQAAKLKYPLIPFQDREGIIITGHFSGFAEKCGLDWKGNNFQPLMTALRYQHKDWSDIQFAYAGMLHGASMQSAVNSKIGQTCPDEFRKKVSNNLIVSE